MGARSARCTSSRGLQTSNRRIGLSVFEIEMTLSEILVASFTGMLVIVGVLQWWLIHRQDQHFRMSERAWVMAQIDGDRRKWSDGKVHILEGSGTSGDSTGTWIILSCHNEGKSPAWIYEKRVKFEVAPRLNPAPDFDSLPVVFNGREPIGIGQAAIPNVTKLHRLEIAEGHTKPGDMMIIYGIVRYHDIFKESRTATFGYQITGESEGYILGRLTESAYNDNT